MGVSFNLLTHIAFSIQNHITIKIAFLAESRFQKDRMKKKKKPLWIHFNTHPNYWATVSPLRSSGFTTLNGDWLVTALKYVSYIFYHAVTDR